MDTGRHWRRRIRRCRPAALCYRRAVIRTGIINIWEHRPEEVGTWWKSQSAERQARLLLGLGVSHGPLIGDAYRSPVATMSAHLSQIFQQGIPKNALSLAAFGPKMLELSRDQTAGAHPYLARPEHSAMARRILGPGALLAPEQGVVLERDAARARELCVHALEHYRQLPNYINSWHRLGLTDDDIASASDRLIDALFAYGGMKAIAERVDAHLSAGADHVCLQVIAGGDFATTRRAWRELASAPL